MTIQGSIQEYLIGGGGGEEGVKFDSENTEIIILHKTKINCENF